MYAIWGSTFLAIRLAVDTVPPFTAAAVRWTLAGAAVVVFVRPRGGWSWGTWARSAGFATLLVVASNGLVTWAETRIASGLASLGVATVAPWLVALEAARPGGRRPDLVTASGVALGLVGVATLVDPRSGLDLPAFGAVLAGSFAFALGSTLSRLRPDAGPPLAAVARQMLTGGLMLAGVAALVGERPGSPSATSALALVWLAVAGSVVGFSLYQWLVRAAPPALAGTYACVNPVVALALGAGLAGEPLGPRTLVAAALVIGGVALVTAARSESGPLRRWVDWSRRQWSAT